MLELTMYNIRKQFGDNQVLFDAGFTLYEGDKAGIVGANGSGKSTILKLLAGIEPLDIDYRKICEGRARILVNKGTSIAYLDQIPEYPEEYTVNDVLNLAFQELYEMEERMRALESDMARLQGEELDIALKRYSSLQERYDVKGGYDREEKFSKVCSGLKLDGEFLQKHFGILSGGEKTTVILGKILLENPDILLLDEPTNHLDMESVEWLEGQLKSYRGIVIIVSHDRYFLDNVTNKIIELENMACETYMGNYSDYTRQKEENLLLQYENYREQQKKINAMEKAIKDLRGWAQGAGSSKFFRRAASMQIRLEKMEHIDRPVFEKRNIRFSFKAAERSGNEVFKVTGLSKSFGGRTILKDAGLFVTLGERIAIVGPNGCGKSTFIKILTGEMEADSGSIIQGANLKIAYLPQNITFNNAEDTVIECFREDRYILEGKAREYLAKYMFCGKDAFKKVKHLSGGEKVRLKLAMLLYDETNLLVMDEPTNHLDIDSIETLETALEDYEGTILFISHDRYFINKVCDRVVALEDCRFMSYPGSFDDYKSKLGEAHRMEGPLLSGVYNQSGGSRPAIGGKSGKVSGSKAGGKRDETGNPAKQADISGLEESIKAVETEICYIDKAMLEQGADHDELNRLYNKREELNAELDKMLEHWYSCKA